VNNEKPSEIPKVEVRTVHNMMNQKPSTANIIRNPKKNQTYDFDVDSNEEEEEEKDQNLFKEKQEFYHSETRQLKPWEISRTGKLQLNLVSATLTEAQGFGKMDVLATVRY